jgi:Holliday junction resolvase
MMKRGRRDNNHATLVRTLRGLGCTVLDLANVGSGCPDIVAGYRGSNHLIEIKNTGTAYGKRGFSKTQSDFARTWNGGEVHVVKTEAEAEALVEKWSKCSMKKPQ